MPKNLIGFLQVPRSITGVAGAGTRLPNKSFLVRMRSMPAYLQSAVDSGGTGGIEEQGTMHWIIH